MKIRSVCRAGEVYMAFICFSADPWSVAVSGAWGNTKGHEQAPKNRSTRWKHQRLRKRKGDLHGTPRV